MTSLLLWSLVLVAAGGGDTERPVNPLAPSLRQPTKKEIERYEDIVERFIQFDTGKLPGAAGKKAFEEFKALPPEAIFVLIDGFNRAANMEASCPAVIQSAGRSSIRR